MITSKVKPLGTIHISRTQREPQLHSHGVTWPRIIEGFTHIHQDGEWPHSHLKDMYE